jgi:hypothetical protein
MGFKLTYLNKKGKLLLSTNTDTREATLIQVKQYKRQGYLHLHGKMLTSLFLNLFTGKLALTKRLGLAFMLASLCN